MQSTTSTPPQTKSLELLNEGTYGCIYKPNIPCSNDEETTTNEQNQNQNHKKTKVQYISKIQRKTGVIENEELLGKQITEKIPHYSYRFAPILKTCPVQINLIHPTNQCDLIKEQQETEEETTTETTTQTSQQNNPAFISSKIKYVGKHDLQKILKQWNTQFPPQTTALKILDGLEFLIESIHQLDKIHITHNDIKENNIIYDEINHTMVFIDLGLSFPSNLTLKEYDVDCNIIYSSKNYPYYHPEQQIIGYILQNPTETVISQSSIQNIVNHYFEDNPNQEVWKPDNIFTAEEIHATIETFQKKAEKWKDKPREELFTLLFRDFQCWDIYSLFVAFLFQLPKYTQNNPDITTIVQILKKNIFKDEAETQTQYIETIREEIAELKRKIYLQ